jgi:hypothetical protein
VDSAPGRPAVRGRWAGRPCGSGVGFAYLSEVKFQSQVVV